MSSTHNSDVRTSSTNAPAIAIDLSRPRLRRMSVWIRDELDPIIAREGPGSLTADDVLVLHDLFQSLQVSTKITALDLRATGIHKAVMEISGIATRWPGRLCDDCNMVIKIWTSKFGRLEDLHPFLYGRGGCLEGIASGGELSKQALLRRWEHDCPERIAPSVSHQHGNLGFRAGSWWINALFAWHAGIIDYDTVEGGVCYDNDTAYALFLKDNGELEAPTETHFTYRCSRVDRGVFRLTAATPKSRNPIRVLRSHSLNSIWGPRAGVRYEGLYRVVGWSIRRKASNNIAHQENESTDIQYDINFQRDDPCSMEKVIKVPTAFQVDEFSEYKRLRKVHRESQRNRKLHPNSDQKHAQYIPTKIAPQIATHGAHMSPSPLQSRSPMLASPGGSRVTTFGRSQVHGGSDLSSHPVFKIPSMSTVPRALAGYGDTTQTLPNNDSAMQTQNDVQQMITKSLFSFTSSINTMQSHEDLREITPWVDYDPQFALPLSEPEPPVTRIKRDRVQPGEASSQTGRSSIRTPSPVHGNKKKGHRMHKHSPESPLPDESPRTNVARATFSIHSRHSTTRHLDGAKDQVDGGYIFDREKSHQRRNSIFSGFRTQESPAQKSPELAFGVSSTPDYSKPRSRSRDFLSERRDAISPVVSPAGFQMSTEDTRNHLNADGTLAVEQDDMGKELPCEVLVDFRNPWASHSKKD